jgi:hypothetical protein
LSDRLWITGLITECFLNNRPTLGYQSRAFTRWTGYLPGDWLLAVTGHLPSVGTLCPVTGEILYTKFEILGLGFRVHCGACELSSLASVIWLSLSFSRGFGFEFEAKEKKKRTPRRRWRKLSSGSWISGQWQRWQEETQICGAGRTFCTTRLSFCIPTLPPRLSLPYRYSSKK